MALNFGSRVPVTGNFEFIGKGVTASGASIDNAGGYTASQTNQMINGANHIPKVWHDGAEFSGAFKDFSISINNGLRPQDKVGSADLAGVGVGRFNMSGTANPYFEDLSLYNKFINNQYNELVYLIDDDSTTAIGNVYVLTMPRVKFTTMEVPATAADTDIMQPLSWQATQDSTTGATLVIERIPQ